MYFTWLAKKLYVYWFPSVLMNFYINLRPPLVKNLHFALLLDDDLKAIYKVFHASHFLPVNFGAWMLIECCILPKANTKRAKASGAQSESRWGEQLKLINTNVTIPSLSNGDLLP